MAGNILERHGSELEKTFDSYIRGELGSSKGGRLRKYSDWEVITGESRVTKTGGQGNYTHTAPNLYGSTDLSAFNGKMSGNTRSQELTPQFRYGYEVLNSEQKAALGGKFKGSEEIFKKLREAIELAEDIEIVTAMESADKMMPAYNKIGDATKTIHDKENIALFKRLLVTADSMYSGNDNVMQVGAFMLIDTVDWAGILTHNIDGAIFASNDYQHLTGIDGRRVTSVLGVAIEKCNPFEHPMGPANRVGLVTPGVARLCTYNNIIGASWESSIVTDSKDDIFNGDTFMAVVKKSMGAKVLDAKGCWKFSFKHEDLNVFTDDAVGSEINPMVTKAKV